MANSNVRFYRLATLPSFEEKHKGIFVHVTSKLTRTIKEDTYTYSWGKLNPDDIQKILIQKIVEKETPTPRPLLVPDWMDLRRIDTVESGLWFGGENGWELLSNDTTSGAIDAAIDAKINALDVPGYAQAEITGSTLTIFGIKEVDGRIVKDEDTGKKLEVAIDGAYDKTDNKIATQDTVTTAINGLNVGTIQAVTTASAEGNTANTVLTFKGVKEANGKIAQGDGATTFIVGDAKLKIQIGSDEAGAFEVFSANAQSNGAIKLDENVFKKKGDAISVIALTDVASNNKLVTEQDIANLAGAMYYKGSIASNDGWPANGNVKAGYVWIASGNFEHGNESIESGDLIVFNANNDNSKYTIVQSNITLGIGDGQIAANVGALADGNLVVGVNSTTGSKGIKTVEFDVTNLTGTTGKNERNLTLDSKLADQELQSEGVGSVEGLYHSVGITDTFTIMGRDMSKSFSISSRNRSISIEKVGNETSTDAQIDLIWNTVMDA